MKIINSSNAPAAVGPYSQAVVLDNLIFLSGQLGLNPKSGELADGIEDQTEQAFKNIQSVLKEEGLNLKNVVKVLVLLNNIADFGKVNEIYENYFSEPYPARSAFAVAALPKGALVEIEVIASKN